MNQNTTSVSSPVANDLVAKLESGDSLDDNFWKNLADFLEDNEGSAEAKIVLQKLTLPRIAEICSDFPIYANRVGSAFAKWVQSSGFDFDFCDALANRLEMFISETQFDTKIDCLMALLELGTSHNRWYVERKFFRLCSPSMQESLAKRLALQFRVSGTGVCGQIQHLENSISVNRNAFHPTLAATLGDICK